MQANTVSGIRGPYCGWADLIVSDHKIDSLAKELPTVTESHRGLPLALPGRCFLMESIEAAERVPPEQEIHVSYLAVYPLSNEGCDTVAIDTAVGTCFVSLTVRCPSGLH